MNIYSRARKHIDMKRVKELKEEKDIAELEQQREIVLAEISRLHKEKNKHYDWRKELKEGMTTSSLGMINYPAAGDVNLDTAFPSFTLSGSSEIGHNQVVKNMQGDRSKFDTMVVSINTTSSDWVVVQGDELNTFGSGGAGTHTVIIPGTYSSLYFSASDEGTFTASVHYQRRKPVNVFVGLDDPEANSFIRDGQSDNLSPAQRKNKVEEQLRSSKEYLDKMFGEGIFTGATEISDVEPQQPFKSDMQTGDNPDIDGTVIAGYGLRPDGTQGLSMPGDIVPDHNGNPMKLVPDPSRGRGFNRWVPVKKAGGGGTMVAHHEPEGEVLVEKERLMSPKELIRKLKQ